MKHLSYKESYFLCVSKLTQHMKDEKITVSELSQHMGVPRKKLGEVLNKKRIDIDVLDHLCAILLCSNVEIKYNL